MDAVSQTAGSYANVEMQKIGYHFPIERVDCYSADIVMHQYAKAKAELGNDFTFKKINKVSCIIIMEKSPAEFKTADLTYVHRRNSVFHTGIYNSNAGLHEDFFICLDVFQEKVHNITTNSNLLDAWLTFMSATSQSKVDGLITSFPEFVPLYQEITEFVKDPKALIAMLSEELYIMDRNTERLMAEELMATVQEKDSKIDSLENERNTFRDTLQNKRNAFKAERNTLEQALTEKDALISELLAKQNKFYISWSKNIELS